MVLIGEQSRWNIAYGEANAIYAQNAETNADFPGKWSRFEWTPPTSDGLFYCQSEIGAETFSEAESAPEVDISDLTNGCREIYG